MGKYIKQFSQWLTKGETYSINKTSKSFVCKVERGIMTPKIWTDAQAKDLDRRFKESEARMKNYIDHKINDLRHEMNQKFDTVFKYFETIVDKLEIKIEK